MYYMFHKVVLILSATESILIVQQEAQGKNRRDSLRKQAAVHCALCDADCGTA